MRVYIARTNQRNACSIQLSVAQVAHVNLCMRTTYMYVLHCDDNKQAAASAAAAANNADGSSSGEASNDIDVILKKGAADLPAAHAAMRVLFNRYTPHFTLTLQQ
jgi:hypothetical protein